MADSDLRDPDESGTVPSPAPRGQGLVPGRRVVATAPVRVADVGGWTDTWFAGRGAVCSVAVGPGATAEVEVRPGAGRDPVRVWAPDLGESWSVAPDPEGGWAALRPGDRPLVAHAVAAVLGDLPEAVVGPGGVSLEITVRADVPPASALGSSASVLVALVAALAATVDRPLDADGAARAAFAVETTRAGRESGVQDHVAAAHGGISWIEVEPYPRWQRSEVPVPVSARSALASRLVTVHLGGGHDSSVLHRVVIEAAEAGDAEVLAALSELRGLAALARRDLAAGDLAGWGAVLTAATQEQSRLHPALVGDDARAVIDLGAAHGARGAKVNGAGGAGGTVTLVGPEDPAARAALGRALVDAGRGWEVLDLVPHGGLEVAVTEL